MSKYEMFENEDSSENSHTVTIEHENIDVSAAQPEAAGVGSSAAQAGRTIVVGQSMFTSEPNGAAGIVIADPAADTSSDGLEPWQRSLRRVVEHLAFRVLSLVLIIIDIGILIDDLTTTQSRETLTNHEIASLVFVCYFIIEVFLRMAAKGVTGFFAEWYNVVDLVVIVISFIVTVMYAAIDLGTGYAKLVVAGRLIRVVIFARLWTERKNLVKSARQMVSENKRRYQKDGFDLDLTYVTEHVIAMSFPSRGKMSLYRNPIKEVARFLDTKHKDHYKVYNLCSERTYDDSYFHGRVERFIIDDHNVPSVKDMVRFVNSVKLWLAEDKQNVIAVHCKGGKGRTGTMICIWLVEAGLFGSAEASLDYFGTRRTDLSVGNKFQGVETPSQNRYVGYFEIVKDKYGGVPPEEVPLKLRHLKINGLRGIGRGDGSDFTCEIFNGRMQVFECDFGMNRNCQAEYNYGSDSLDVLILNCPVLSGDVKLRFQCSSRNVPKGYEKCPFYFWLHTSFIENFRFYVQRDCLDNPHKPKTWKVFGEHLSIELKFSAPDDHHDVPLH